MSIEETNGREPPASDAHRARLAYALVPVVAQVAAAGRAAGVPGVSLAEAPPLSAAWSAALADAAELLAVQASLRLPVVALPHFFDATAPLGLILSSGPTALRCALDVALHVPACQRLRSVLVLLVATAPVLPAAVARHLPAPGHRVRLGPSLPAPDGHELLIVTVSEPRASNH